MLNKCRTWDGLTSSLGPSGVGSESADSSTLAPFQASSLQPSATSSPEPIIKDPSQDSTLTDSSQYPPITGSSATTHSFSQDATNTDFFQNPTMTDFYQEPTTTNSSQDLTITDFSQNPTTTESPQGPVTTDSFQNSITTDSSQDPTVTENFSNPAPEVSSTLIPDPQTIVPTLLYISSSSQILNPDSSASSVPGPFMEPSSGTFESPAPATTLPPDSASSSKIDSTQTPIVIPSSLSSPVASVTSQISAATDAAAALARNPTDPEAINTAESAIKGALQGRLPQFRSEVAYANITKSHSRPSCQEFNRRCRAHWTSHQRD